MEKIKNKMIFTLGTSNRKIKEFLEILKEYKIEIVADVRRFPSSRLFPQFKKENLEKILKENKMKYLHFEGLGGFRARGYENYIKTKEFQKALEKLIEISKSKKLVIICAERFPWKCHRALISQELEKRKIKIFHILEKGKIWQPKLEPKEIKPKCQKLKKKI
jgi:uncharacterized protein (DUF488 family)